MMRVDVVGAGAFGSALAIALARAGRDVTLWGRNAPEMTRLAKDRAVPRLPGVRLPENVVTTSDFADLTADTVLLAVPTQALRGVLDEAGPFLDARHLVACCKGIDLETGHGPTALIAHACPNAVAAVLTGPSFARDIANGLPTALTLACEDEAIGISLQHTLSTDVLRLYRSTDTRGAELGGALKNVIAIAAGLVIGSGLGESARAALITRGIVEMRRMAVHFGAEPESLAGLSGVGDLVLTCTSMQSRNFAHGCALGRGDTPETGKTVEGVVTSLAVRRLADQHGLDMPISTMVSAVLEGNLTVHEAKEALLSRALREE